MRTLRKFFSLTGTLQGTIIDLENVVSISALRPIYKDYQSYENYPVGYDFTVFYSGLEMRIMEDVSYDKVDSTSEAKAAERLRVKTYLADIRLRMVKDWIAYHGRQTDFEEPTKERDKLIPNVPKEDRV